MEGAAKGMGLSDTSAERVRLRSHEACDGPRMGEECCEAGTRYPNVLDNLLEGCQVIGRDWRYLYVNKAAAGYDAHSPQELLGRTIIEVHPGFERTDIYSRMRRCMDDGVAGCLEEEVTLRDGDRRWFQLRFEPVPEGIFLLSLDITERKRSEELSRRAAQRHRFVLDNLLEGVMLIDGTSLRVLDGNLAAARMYGFDSIEQAVGVDPLEFVLPDERGRVLRMVLDYALQQDLRQVEEIRSRTRDGRELTVEARGAAIEYEGKPVVVVSLRDVTRLRQAREELKLKDLAIGSASAGIAMADPDGNVGYANDSFLRMWGYDRRDEVLGKPALEFWQSENEALGAIEVIMSGDGWVGELVGRRKDGSLFEVEAAGSPVLDASGRAVGIMAWFIDISDRKRGEEAFRQSEEKLRLVFESIGDGIAVVALDGSIIEVNETVVRMLGYRSKQELIGHKAFKFIARGDHDRAARVFCPGLWEGRGGLVECGLLAGNGSTLPGEICASTMTDASGEPAGFVAVIKDISEREKARKRLERSFANLARTVSRAMGSRDPYTTEHQRKVAWLARLMGSKMGLEKERLQGLYIGGLLHDIGKLSVPEGILNKPGELMPEELGLVRLHAKQGYEILKEADLPWPVAEMALHHHERIDGSGYPDGLSGERLTVENRILGVCDVVEAMSSHRPYRPARSKQEVVEELQGGCGVKYDPAVVAVMLDAIANGELECLRDPLESAEDGG